MSALTKTAKPARALVLGLGLLVLGGCASSTDPREGGFFGGVQGLGSGAYDARLKERDDRLATLRETQAELSGERATLEASQLAAEEALEQERAEYARLERDIDGLERRLAELKKTRGAQDSRVADLQSRLDSLQQDMNKQSNALDALEGSGMPDDAMEQRRRELLAQREALRKEYDLLMSLTMDLAR